MANPREAEARDEDPVLAIDDYALAVHVVARRAEGAAAGDLDTSATVHFERDILAYAYLADRPFVTGLVRPRAQVVVEFPPEIRFESDDGTLVALRCPPERRRRTFTAVAARTDFPSSGISVLHLVLGPAADAPTGINEWDVIKLAKLWTGGEGLPEPGRAGSDAHVRVRFDGGPPLSFDDTVARLFPGWTPLDRDAALRGGTVQLFPAEPGGLMAAIGRLDTEEGEPAEREWRELVAWGGIVQGLFDHRLIEAVELRDVFAPFEPAKSRICGFHKGTLLAIGAHDLGFVEDADRGTRQSPIGVSPYLAVPHAVVLHNDERTRRARDYSGRQRGRDGAFVGISRTAGLLAKERDALASFLPPLFHYTSEQVLYRDGHDRRGLTHVFDQSASRVAAESAHLDARIKRRDLTFVLAGIALAVLAGLQSALAKGQDILPFWPLPAVGLLVIMGALLWSRRL